jgi:NAD+ synthase
MENTQIFTLALAQTNMVVGDVAGNAARIIAFAQNAAQKKADLVVFPEMALPGYPCEDLVLVRAFRESVHAALAHIATETKNLPCGLLVGSLWQENDKNYNASILIEKGEITVLRKKMRLPNYGVFDEKRIFEKGTLPEAIIYRGLRLGVLICEEVWDADYAEHLALKNIDLMIVQNGSPYHIGKAGERLAVVKAASAAINAPIAYVNLVGGQDELVFDGRSYILPDEKAKPHRAKAFEEDLQMVVFEKIKGHFIAHAQDHSQPLCDDETIYRALVLGLRDYVGKNGFPGVVIGLSGGIDSGLSAAIAVDALGADKVLSLRMPSPYTSDDSLQDAQIQAEALGINIQTIAITDLMQITGTHLAPLFAGRARDTTEENIQARLRGVLLMALSNKLGHMVLTTGNKSEMSVGYATLYGDMCGGFSVLKDVYKTTVFALSKWRNTLSDAQRAEAGFLGATGEVIPARMISKPPSAELREDQKDSDSLPPYDLLDEMLRGLIERRLSIAELVQEGMDEATMRHIAKLVIGAEYKRRQSAPGVKITPMAFGRDRRWPITNHWKFGN